MVFEQTLLPTSQIRYEKVGVPFLPVASVHAPSLATVAILFPFRKTLTDLPLAPVQVRST